MEEDRVDKAEYKTVVAGEKRKLLIQAIILTVLAGVLAGAFYATLASTNPHVITSTI
jgi:hypothetical protein